MENNKTMEKEKISKLALKLSIPMIISMLSMGIYNLIDTAYISKISNDALLGVSLAFPIQIIISSIGLGLGIGINSFIGRTLGAKEHEKTKYIISNGIILGLFVSVILTLIFNENFLNIFFKHFTKNKNVINLGINYLKIITLFSICNVFQNIFGKILEAHGKTSSSMISNFIAIIINIILDPILIFGINGHLKLGIKGAAIATVIGRTIGLIFSIIFILKSQNIKIPKLNDFKLKKEITNSILKVAFPTILTESIAPITTIILNDILKGFDENAVSFYGIYYKVQSIIFMIVSGLNYGMIPILSFNIGAKNKQRTIETIKLFVIWSIIITTIGTLLFILLPNAILNIFNANSQIINIGVNGLRIFAIGFVFAGISFIITGTFNAMGKANSNILIFLTRKVIIPFGFIILTKNLIGICAIWWSFTIAEIFAFIISIILFKKKYNELKFDN